MTSRFAGHSQLLPGAVLWSVGQAHCGLEEDTVTLHVTWTAGRTKASLKANEEFSTYMASFEWWLIQACGTKVRTLSPCHKTEILVFHEAIHEGVFRTFTIKKFWKTFPVKFLQLFPLFLLGKSVGSRHQQQTSGRQLVHYCFPT